jgi:hypothetical protein
MAPHWFVVFDANWPGGHSRVQPAQSGILTVSISKPSKPVGRLAEEELKPVFPVPIRHLKMTFSP